MKKTISKIAICLFTVAFLTQCAKKGDTGPAGKDGNANVVGTNTVTLTSQWGYLSANDTYYTTINVPGISQAVVDKGSVMVYIKSTTGWYALPYAALLANDDFLKFEFVPGAVNLYYRENSSSSTLDPTSQNWTVRIVIIPASLKPKNIDHTNYRIVKEAYNLKD